MSRRKKHKGSRRGSYGWYLHQVRVARRARHNTPHRRRARALHRLMERMLLMAGEIRRTTTTSIPMAELRCWGFLQEPAKQTHTRKIFGRRWHKKLYEARNPSWSASLN